MYAKQEIFCCEDKPSRKTSFSKSCEEVYNKFDNISDEVVSVLGLDYESEDVYEYTIPNDEFIYEDDSAVQRDANNNDELSGLIFNAESDHLVKREYGILEFEEHDEFTDLC